MGEEKALLSLLRAAADGETLTDQARCRLCEVRDFDPYETFKILQGGWHIQKDYITTFDFFAWLSQQPHRVSATSLESATEVLRPYMTLHDELRYDGFLRMCFPKHPAQAWMKEAILRRGGSQMAARGPAERMPPEVAYRLCQVFECEKDLCSHLKFHHRSIKELRLTKDFILRFLDPEDGMCADMGGFISPVGVRRVLVEKWRALSEAQCDALIQRINPPGASLLNFDDLARCMLLPPELKWDSRPSTFDPLLDTTTRFASGSTLRDASWLEASGPLSLAADFGATFEGSGDPYRSTSPPPPPRLVEPMALRRAYSPGRGGMAEASYRSSPSTPMPPYMQDSAYAYKRNGVSWEFDRSSTALGMSTWRGHKDYYSPPPRLPDSGMSALLSPIPATATPRAGLPGGSARLGATAVRPAGLVKSPTPQIRPRSPGYTRRAASLPLAGRRKPESLAAAARAIPFCPSSGGLSSSRAPAAHLTASRSSLAWANKDHDQLVQKVLQVMAHQAAADGRIEEAKTLLPAGCTLTAIFRSLDRFRKGYITDSDLWQLAKDFGSAVPLGSLCALTREIQARRLREFATVAERGGVGGLPGELTLRELGMLVLPAGSEEYRAVGAAGSDAEAKSILYILKNSEPCPRCGMRVQRDAEVAGCPSVTCPVCGCTFRCYCVVGDTSTNGDLDAPLSGALRYQIYRLLSTAATAAQEIETDRRSLALVPGFDVFTLGDVFEAIAGGQACVVASDLRRAFVLSGFTVPEREMDLLWRRYSPRRGELNFTDFASQLKPSESLLTV